MLLENLYRLSAMSGLLTCLFSGLLRLSGSYYILGFQTLTLYQAGIGIILTSVLLKLELIHRAKNGR